MATVIDGKNLSEEIRAEIRKEVEELGGAHPCLAAVLVGDDPASAVYVRNKRRACEATGLESIQINLPAETTQTELLQQVAHLNQDPKVNGILVQLPLPRSIDPARIASAILPEKDVDGLHPLNAGRLLANEPGLYPCTPVACIEIMDRHGFQIEGKRAVVIGRSEIVGKPIALLLLHRNATVTICHSRTQQLPEIVREADIVIAAIGQPRFVKGDWIKPGAAVIDVGINRIDKKLVGDVDFDVAVERAGLITPVPGGVGPLTITMLLRNTLRAFKQQSESRKP